MTKSMSRGPCSLTQPQELLRALGHVVVVWRGCAGDVGVRTGNIRRALQKPSRWPGQHELISLLRKRDRRPDYMIRKDFACAKDFCRIKEEPIWKRIWLN